MRCPGNPWGVDIRQPSITKCPLGRKSSHNLDRCSYSSFIFVLNCHEHSSLLNFPYSYLGQRQRPVHRSIVHLRRDTVMLRFNPVGKYKSHICLEMSKDWEESPTEKLSYQPRSSTSHPTIISVCMSTTDNLLCWRQCTVHHNQSLRYRDWLWLAC